MGLYRQWVRGVHQYACSMRQRSMRDREWVAAMYCLSVVLVLMQAAHGLPTTTTVTAVALPQLTVARPPPANAAVVLFLLLAL